MPPCCRDIQWRDGFLCRNNDLVLSIGALAGHLISPSRIDSESSQLSDVDEISVS